MVNVDICVGSHCSLVGALDILDLLESLQEEYPDRIKINKVKCMDKCKNINNAPVVKIEDKIIYSAQSQLVMSEIMERIK